MKLPEAVEENLTFLLAELDGQLAMARAYFETPDSAIAVRLIGRAGYAHNLWSRIQNGCARGMAGKRVPQTRAMQLRQIDTLARNLDLISRLARRCLDHAERVDRVKLLRAEAYGKPLLQVSRSLAQVQPTLSALDSPRAIEIGQARDKIDAAYERLFITYTRDMRGSAHTADLANALLAAQELRRMGEALQGISEAILSISLGQSVQFERYFTLRSALSSAVKGKEGEIALEPLAETRSGSAISGVSGHTAKGAPIDAVYKDGDRKKVREEREGVKSWHSVYPGLAPRILAYESRGASAALLIEHLPGQTFEDIVLGGSEAGLAAAQKALHRTVRDIWKRTLTPDPARLGAMDQLAARMEDVYRVHPQFRSAPQTVMGVKIDSFDRLIARARAREAGLKAPFSVYIHGDFNLDNILFDPAEKKIHFIDLHRSRYMDYVQDVSVFMVSNYRLQLPDAAARRRSGQVACDLQAMAAKFARAHGDRSFSYRLALGLARSFASSTRFIFDRDHASRMMLRARFLLETALAVPEGREDRLRLPMTELFFD